MKKINYEQAKVLEDIIGKKWKKIRQVNEIKWNTKGVKINNCEITGLGLFQYQLQTLPESIGNLKTLESLTLDGNQLSTLPESIGNLKSLKSLYLSDNQLSSLPESTTKLKSLQTLWLAVNRLHNLPESMGNLKSLEVLNLDDNQITILPQSIGNINSLKLLYLSRNKLVTLPESIGNLKTLKSLTLDRNQLSTIPESIGNLKSLKTLNLSYNKLKFLPNSMENLKDLQIIELQGNPLNQEFKIMLKTADGLGLRKIYEKQKLKLIEEAIDKERAIIEKLIQEKKFSNATLKLEYIKKKAGSYNLSEIVSWVEKKLDLCDKLEKTENLKKKIPLVENLIREMKYSNAIRELNVIKKIAKKNHLWGFLGFSILASGRDKSPERWVERNLTLCIKHIIKKTVLELGIKFARIQIAEISEVCGIDDTQLIVGSVKDMIANKEIYAQYFSSTKSVAFDQQANIDEIDKLMEHYKKWEKEDKDKV